METKVHRADLRTPPPATLSCLESEEELTQRLAAIYGPVTTFPAPRTPVDAAALGGCLPYSTSCQKSCLKNDVDPKNEVETNVLAQDQEYTFYLFRRSGESSPQKIILEQDEKHLSETGPDHRLGGFLVPQRNKSYYFSSLALNGYKEQLLLSAVDGDTVKQWSKKRAWGLEVPWRVQVLRAPNSTQKCGTKETPNIRQSTMESTIESKLSMLSEVSETCSQAREKNVSILGKKRPSKKNRIAMRKKQRAALAIQEQLVRQKELKELAEKEKKIRRNRGKKIKRKIKKKREKGNLEDTNKI